MNGAFELRSGVAGQYEARYQRSAAFRERLDVWTDLIEKHVVPGCRVLDAGCGPGVLTCVAAKDAGKVVAFDANAEMISIAKQRCQEMEVSNVDLRTGKLGQPEMTDPGGFDVVLCSSVLEYLSNLDGAIDWLVSSLRPGGVLIVSMPNGASLYRKAERLVFRLTGRPAYYADVRNVPLINEFESDLAGRGLSVVDRRFYAGPSIVRKLISPERIDNLFVVSARLGNAG